jgi:hypothetical protein
LGKFQYQLQSFGTTLSNVKVLDLWNGSTNNLAPGTLGQDWIQPGYDDSAWVSPVTPTFQSFAAQFTTAQYLGAGYGPFGPPVQFAPWSTPPSKHAAFLARWTFTAPPDPWRAFIVSAFLSPSGLDGIFAINGHVTIGDGWRNTEILEYIAPGETVVVALSGQWVQTASPQPPAAESRWSNGGGGSPPFCAWIAGLVTFYDPTSIPSGSVVSWGTITPGTNDKGVLGTGDTSTHLTPTSVDMTAMPVPANAAKIASNGKTTLILTAAGQVYGCGDNSQGMALATVGVTDSSTHPSPVLINTFGGATVTGGNTIVDISIGDDCAIALNRFGDAMMWGANVHGSFGRGNTTPSRNPILASVGICEIAVGKNFSLLAATPPTSRTVISAGQNTYGQLGQSTSGADVLTFGFMTATNFPFGSELTVLSGGEDASLILYANFNMYVCGRAEYGALGNTAYAAGTGVNKMVSTPINSFAPSPADAVQAGPVTYVLVNDGTMAALGDGTPYGGAGDGLGNVIYGTGGSAYGVVATATSPFFTFFSLGIAYSSGGSNNHPYSPGSSLIAYAAITDKGSDDSAMFGARASLRTWGWGGAGQMGSGSDPTTNLLPVHINGLGDDVVAATVAEAVVFAIALAGPIPGRGRSYAQVIG